MKNIKAPAPRQEESAEDGEKEGFEPGENYFFSALTSALAFKRRNSSSYEEVLRTREN